MQILITRSHSRRSQQKDTSHQTVKDSFEQSFAIIVENLARSRSQIFALVPVTSELTLLNKAMFKLQTKETSRIVHTLPPSKMLCLFVYVAQSGGVLTFHVDLICILGNNLG